VNIKNFLFSYGSLQNAEIQLTLYNRKLVGIEDRLLGYTFSDQKIEARYPIIYKTQNLKDSITGVVYEISEEELLLTDAYEGSSYQRVQVQLASGIIAWCYVMHN